MNAALITFLLEQVLPFVIQNLPALLKFLGEFHPLAHTELVTAINKALPKNQGPGFDWHSGP